MIEVEALAAQRDVLFRRIERLPENVVERPTSGPIIVAHSETGHHHAIEGSGVRLFEDADAGPLARYLEVAGAFADVAHHRAYDRHETPGLPRGLWEVRRQRQWVPQGWRSVED
ncbi:MAG TPA: hypothetical protein VIU64_21285 [Polyangia bacterium]